MRHDEPLSRSQADATPLRWLRYDPEVEMRSEEQRALLERVKSRLLRHGISATLLPTGRHDSWTLVAGIPDDRQVYRYAKHLASSLGHLHVQTLRSLSQELLPPPGSLPRWLRFDPPSPTLMSPQQQYALLSQMSNYLWARGALPHLFAWQPGGKEQEAPADGEERAAFVAAWQGRWMLVAGIAHSDQAYHLIEIKAGRLGLRFESTQGRTFGLDPFERRTDLD